MKAKHTKPLANQVPDGYALVPCHATPEMLSIGKRAHKEEFLFHQDPDSNIQGIWKAMIAKAPAQPEARIKSPLDHFDSVISPAILQYATGENELLIRRLWDDVRRAVLSQPDVGAGQWIRCPDHWLEEARRDFESGDSADHYNLLRDLLNAQPPQGEGQ